MANPELDSLNVPVNSLKSRDYNKDGTAPKDETSDRFFAEADKLLSSCQAKAGSRGALYVGPQADVLCREDQSVVLNFTNGREIILKQDRTLNMPLDARK
jgi:hypothetical protein